MAQVDMPESDDIPLTDLPAATLLTHAPEVGAAATGYSLAVYRHSKLSLRELEAARYRTALINGCNVCKGFRSGRDLAGMLERAGASAEEGPAARGPAPDEAFYDAVPVWREAACFSERERIAIELAERMGEAPQSFEGDEAFWSRVHANFTHAELVDMTLAIGSWIALGRTVHVLELDLVCAPVFDTRAA